MTKIEELKHYEVEFGQGASIVILDTGAALSAEDTSMLQALHSRSTGGVKEHLQSLIDRGSENFMSNFYVKYGHKSIGDCGMATVFIEGISMLAAKAIQDSKLYNGQEASTRYIDFANQPFLNPLGSATGTAVVEEWRRFYLKAVAEMQAELLKRYPMETGENEARYQKAINARAFDITRGFLPAGATTNIAWTTTLRQFDDRIMQLRFHPLPEVREIAEQLLKGMLAVYPNSFKEDDEERQQKYAPTYDYLKSCADSYYYHDPECPELALVRDGIHHSELAEYTALLAGRPAKAELPKWLGAMGEVAFKFTLDFGSFRDIQRHRAVTQRMPLLTSDIGFHEWYLSELTDSLREEAEELITRLSTDANGLTDDEALRQYYLPMGFKISNHLSGDLPALVYLTELRATSLVHPTLAVQAAKMADLLRETFSDVGLAIHLDSEPGRFDTKRGDADIELKD